MSNPLPSSSPPPSSIPPPPSRPHHYDFPQEAHFWCYPHFWRSMTLLTLLSNPDEAGILPFAPPSCIVNEIADVTLYPITLYLRGSFSQFLPVRVLPCTTIGDICRGLLNVVIRRAGSEVNSEVTISMFRTFPIDETDLKKSVAVPSDRYDTSTVDSVNMADGSWFVIVIRVPGARCSGPSLAWFTTLMGDMDPIDL
eukprot:PhF_6_TR41076/c0_g2_i1/m.62224